MNVGRMALITAVTAGSILAQSGTYPDYQTLETHLEKIAKDHSDLAQLKSLGTTEEGRKVLVLQLGTAEIENKPAILFVAGVNASDLAGTEILMRFIESSIRAYGTKDSITSMLNNTTFYFLPRVSPDATETLFLNPAYQRHLNSHSTDLDKDGQENEDGFEDLNGDGFITVMRVSETEGTWIEDPEFPPLMRPAESIKNEVGVYTLYPEGFDNDRDGLLNEDEPGGTDFNKNFTYHYNLFDKGAGPHQISEIETRAIADFAFSHNNIALVFTFADNDNLIKPWESSPKNAGSTKSQSGKPLTEVAGEDAPYFKSVSDSFKAVTGFEQAGRPAIAMGAFSEWAYYHFGRWSFSTPSWVPPSVSSAQPDSSRDMDNMKKNHGMKPGGKDGFTYDQRLWHWLQGTGRQDAFIPWQEIDHPDFPDKKVEVGGFKPLVYNNPPADSLERIFQAYQPFFVKLTGWLPRISIEELKTEQLNENVYRLTFKLVNNGYLSSNPQAAAGNQWAPKVKVYLSLDKNQKLAAGKILNFIECLPGSGGNKPFSWVIISNPGKTVGIEAGSPMTGIIRQTVKLQ